MQEFLTAPSEVLKLKENPVNTQILGFVHALASEKVISKRFPLS
jgi:hypothetical protein